MAASATAPERGLRIGGLVPFSAVDYPGRLSTVVFVQGCPWRCGYCHNPHLQPLGGGHDWSTVRELLARRRGLVDAVVFSGGEPTADPALEAAIAEVRGAGYAVGLHTAGIYPSRLARVLRNVDWVGLDVKAPFGRYDAVTGVPGSGERARASLEAVLFCDADHELRTTYHPALLDEDAVLELAREIAILGVRHYALQEFRARGCGDAVLAADSRPTRPSAALLDGLGALFPRFTFRPAQ
jgi:anaerobic ribonucleoside-triphosphate reductase activating protein